MNTFTVGDRVVHLTTKNTGEICNSFYTRGIKPEIGMLPVQWDNDERSYVHPHELDFEVFGDPDVKLYV